MKFANVIICDDVRKENSGKHLIIGVYPDDILVPGFPATIAVCAWFQFFADRVGEMPIELRVLQNKKELSRGSAKLIVNDSKKIVTATIIGIIITFGDDGPLEFQCRETKKRWRTMKKLGVGKRPG